MNPPQRQNTQTQGQRAVLGGTVPPPPPPSPPTSNNVQILPRRLMVWMNSVKVTGIWKRNLIWRRNLLEFDITCLKRCFRVKVEALRPGKFARRDANLGGATCVVSADIPPSSFQTMSAAPLSSSPKDSSDPGDFNVAGALLLYKFCRYSINWRHKNKSTTMRTQSS